MDIPSDPTPSPQSQLITGTSATADFSNYTALSASQNLGKPPTKNAFVDNNDDKINEEKPKDGCPFFSFGCEHRVRKSLKSPKKDFLVKFEEFQGQEKDVQNHISKEPIRHMTILCDAVQLIFREAALLQMKWEDVTTQFDNVYIRHDRMSKRYGSHLLWKITNFQEKFNEAKAGSKSVIFSPPFSTGRHGYKFIASAALYGDGKAKGNHMSIFVSLMKGEYDNLLVWPFHHPIRISLISQTSDPMQRRDKLYVIKPNPIDSNQIFLGKPQKERNPSFGAAKFIELDALNGLDFVKDDTIYIQFNVNDSNMSIL